MEELCEDRPLDDVSTRASRQQIFSPSPPRLMGMNTIYSMLGKRTRGGGRALLPSVPPDEKVRRKICVLTHESISTPKTLRNDDDGRTKLFAEAKTRHVRTNGRPLTIAT